MSRRIDRGFDPVEIFICEQAKATWPEEALKKWRKDGGGRRRYYRTAHMISSLEVFCSGQDTEADLIDAIDRKYKRNKRIREFYEDLYPIHGKYLVVEAIAYYSGETPHLIARKLRRWKLDFDREAWQ